MFHRDPILVKAPMGRIYAFTRYYRGNNIFDGPTWPFPTTVASPGNAFST